MVVAQQPDLKLSEQLSHFMMRLMMIMLQPMTVNEARRNPKPILMPNDEAQQEVHTKVCLYRIFADSDQKKELMIIICKIFL